MLAEFERALFGIATGRLIGKRFPGITLRSSASFSTRSANVPRGVEVHLVMNTYATHEAPLVRDWLILRPHWHVHLAPTNSSWRNQVERVVALLTGKQIKRGVHRSVADLRAAIHALFDQHDSEPKLFRWTKSADDILASIGRFRVYSHPAEAG